ncbi:ubiquitin-40S ribosomal protein S27a [Coemansia sp. RSA 454]|nr:ubiquitin-40S ribosomal protein S27a [Coemansia sp. RSA 454]
MQIFVKTLTGKTITLEESTLHLVLRLRGGGKKRKKKTYTTPKKVPHKHKNVKLAILKYYKVDENGQVTRLRRECPNESCGAGVFMAMHKDRQYCGKCHLTYIFKMEGESA